MTKQRHYPKAPIIEAIIDFRVKQADTVSLPHLSRIAELNRDLYPHQEAISTALGQTIFQFGESIGSQSSFTTQQIGFRLTDQTKKQIVQTRLDGFTFSILHPYDCWETFCAEAKRLWKQYQEASDIQNIWRVAVRYINRFNLPLHGEIDLAAFLTTAPHIAKVQGQQIAGFFMQLQLWQEDLECMLILNEGIAPPQTENQVSILFDIDIFQERTNDPWRIENESELWNFLNVLRSRKNEFFEASITEQTRELIK